jgi:hypothetical protein
MIHGGQNQIDIFRVQKNTGGTAYEILADITGTSVATANTDKAIALEEIEGTKPAFQEDGTVQMTLDQYQDNDDFLDFLDAINPPDEAPSANLPDVTLENGVKKIGSASGNKILIISYGGYSEDGTKLKVLAAFGAIKRTSGSYDQKADAYSKPTFEFVGVKTEFDLTIASALFDANVVDATDVGTKIPKIPNKACFQRKFVTKA